MEVLKNIGLVLLGMVLMVAIASLVVAIGCAINGVSFSQQICDWFSSSAPVVEETVETVAHIAI